MSNPAQPLGYGISDYEVLYRASVIDRLEKLDKRFEEVSNRLMEQNTILSKEINNLRVNLSVVEAVLRIKAGIWGASSGLAAGLMMVLIFLLTKVIR